MCADGNIIASEVFGSSACDNGQLQNISYVRNSRADHVFMSGPIHAALPSAGLRRGNEEKNCCTWHESSLLLYWLSYSVTLQCRKNSRPELTGKIYVQQEHVLCSGNLVDMTWWMGTDDRRKDAANVKVLYSESSRIYDERTMNTHNDRFAKALWVIHSSFYWV